MSNNVTLNYYLLDPDGTEKFILKDGKPYKDLIFIGQEIIKY